MKILGTRGGGQVPFSLAFLLIYTSLATAQDSYKWSEKKPVKIIRHFNWQDWEKDLSEDYSDSSLNSMEDNMQNSFQREVTKEKIDKALNNPWPVVINTWAFTEGAKSAWNELLSGGNALDAVEKGCARCEELQCDRTVGYGGSPDENGETTLDAMIMDGETHAVGAVGCLRRVKNAIGVARKVMEHTGHTLLVGELATEFALKMGFSLENLTTEESHKMHNDWKESKCQPNYWRNVSPDPTQNCGPYTPISSNRSLLQTPQDQKRPKIDQFNHDTISMIVIDGDGRIASGSSSNGARNKIPGRVGDAPITGAGSYVDKEVGGAGATGDGDIMARFLPSLLAVEQMRQGKTPEEAGRYAIARIASYYPNFSGAIVTVNLQGEIGAACHNIPSGSFPFSYLTSATGPDVKVGYASCI